MQGSSPIKVFVDSDVIISSLISQSGAAFILLKQTENIELYLSNFSVIELERVFKRLHIDSAKLSNLVGGGIKHIEIDRAYKTLQKQFANCVLDSDDAHIVAGAIQAQATFLVSYNIRRFKAEELRQDFQLVLMTPGTFLQYLRSL
jgi:predicted nucleic acid-binding protein